MAMSMTLDELVVIINAQTGNIKKELAQVNNELSGLDKQAAQTDRQTSKVSKSLAALGKAAKVASVAGIAALATATVASSKASWDQVNAVQQAAAMLGRYYDSADDVTRVQQELIKYAQSDMGVLFNRKDLFQAAGNLAMYGSSAKDVTRQVAILSRGMASNVLTWDEMNAVVGRVISSGKLSRVEFEMLAKAGYNIDKQFVNTNVTAEEFFDILDNSIPKDISQDMNNIVPVGIRLKTAFRNIGNAILGVNELQDGFMPGSLGERIIDVTKKLTNFANNVAPSVRKVVERIIDGFADFGNRALEIARAVGDYLGPKLEALGNSIRSILPSLSTLVQTYLVPLAQILGSLLVFAVGAAIDVFNALVRALEPVIGWLNNNRGAVVGLVAALATLKTALFIQGVINAAVMALTTLRMGFIASTVAAVGLKGALGVALVSAKALMVGMGPLGWAIAGVTALAGLLAGQWASGTTQADRNKAANERLKWATDRLKESQNSLRDAQLALEGSSLSVERAQRSYTEAVKQYGPKSLEAREAAHNLKRAQYELANASTSAKNAQNSLNTAQLSFSRTVPIAVSAAGSLRSAMVSVSGAASGAAIQVGELKKAAASLPSAGGISIGSGGGIQTGGRRAKGGPVSAGKMYMVGENEPELFIPNQSGRILNQKQIAAAGLAGFSAPSIPKLATGGIVTAPTLAMIGEGSQSEAVIPLDKIEKMTGSNHIVVKIGEDTLIDRIVKGINNKAFMSNSTVLEI